MTSSLAFDFSKSITSLKALDSSCTWWLILGIVFSFYDLAFCDWDFDE